MGGESLKKPCLLQPSSVLSLPSPQALLLLGDLGTSQPNQALGELVEWNEIALTTGGALTHAFGDSSTLHCSEGEVQPQSLCFLK
jgi:hypothetical protein